MDLLFIITSSLFFLWVLRDILFWVWLWQNNDYRGDRFFADLKKKKPRITGFYPTLIVLKILFVLIYFQTIFQDYLVMYYHFAITGLYILQTFIIGREIFKNKLKKPRLTLRANLVFIFSILTILLLFVLQLMDTYFWLLLADLSVPLLVTLFIAMLSFPTEVWGDWQTDQALKKLRENRSLIIIGVTGSYGKSLVKDYIARVLGTKFKVIKTHGADNTLVGISNTILKHLESDTEVFVAEMSAYKNGEIAALCKYIKPKIGVLTGINNQYLTLFKTQENITKTNFELVESLPKKAFCIFNGNNKHTAQLFKKSKKQKIIYATELSKHFVPNPDIKAFHITHKPKQTLFHVQFTDTSMKGLAVRSHLSIEYILPAIYIAHHLGMSESEIKKAVSILK